MAQQRKSMAGYLLIGLLTLTACTNTVQNTPTGAQRSPSSSPTSLRTNISQPQSLISAAWEGDAKKVTALLATGANPNACDEKLGCPLIAAAYSGSIETVNSLIESGAKINAQDTKGMTPLMNACLNGKIEVVRLLLSKGADPNITAYPVVDGKPTEATALKLAKGRGYSEIVSVLRQAGAKE
jgi:uncharacterized protein